MLHLTLFFLNKNHNTKLKQQARHYITKHKNTEENPITQEHMTNDKRKHSKINKPGSRTKPTKSEQTQRHTTKSKTIQQHQGQRPRSRTNDKHEYKARTLIKQNRKATPTIVNAPK